MVIEQLAGRVQIIHKALGHTVIPKLLRVGWQLTWQAAARFSTQRIDNHALDAADVNLSVVKNIGRFTRPWRNRAKARANDDLTLIISRGIDAAFFRQS